MRAQFNVRWKPQDAPQTRIGICCGDACQAKHHAAGTWNYSLLFKVQGFYRYRCSGCYQAEVGAKHPQDVVS